MNFYVVEDKTDCNKFFCYLIGRPADHLLDLLLDLILFVALFGGGVDAGPVCQRSHDPLPTHLFLGRNRTDQTSTDQFW